MFGKLSKPLHKAGCYSRNGLRSLVPGEFWRARRQALLNEYDRLPPSSQEDVDTRVAYYNRLASAHSLPESAETIAGFRSGGKAAPTAGISST